MKKLPSIIYTLFIIVLCSYNGYSQMNIEDSLKIDSLKKVLQTEKEDTGKVNTLNRLSYIYNINVNDSAKAIRFADDALTLSITLNFKKGQSMAYYNKAEISGTEDRLKNADSAILISKQIRDTFFISLCYDVKANIFRQNNNSPEALDNYLKALMFDELSGDKEGMAYNNLEIAIVYSELGNTPEVLKSYQYSLKIYNELGNFMETVRCYLGIGEVYYKQNNYNVALHNFQNALLSDEKTNEKYYTGYTLVQIGKTYQMLADQALQKGQNEIAKINFLKAESNYRSAEIIAKKENNNYVLSELFVNMGNLFIKTKRILQSKIYLDKAIELYRLNKDDDGIKESYLGLSLYDSSTGNFKKAYEDHKFYMRYFRSVQNDSSKQKITQIKNQYEYSKKESFAKAEQDRRDEEAKRITNEQYFVIATLGIIITAILIIALIQFRNNKHKQKAYSLLQQQKEKTEQTLLNLKATQSQLVQSEKMASLGELTAGIAHEIQNPLNFVNNFSEVNKEMLVELNEEIDKGNYDDAKSIAKDVIANEEKINHHGKRADSIVKGMLQHSRQTSGVKEPTDINALADEYLRLSYHGLRAKDKEFNATIKTDFDESLSADEAGIGNINIIPQDIGRVLLNLYNNAFYAVAERKKQQPEGYEPTISVSTKRSLSFGEGRGEVIIKVADNGNGIPQSIVEKIFQPFFTTKPTGQGTGLGLSLSYDIIKAHGGEIKVESKEGERTEFIILLPM